MTKYPNITITFTIDKEEMNLRVQTTCDHMNKEEILMALEILNKRIMLDEFETYDNAAYYNEDIIPIEYER